MSFAEPLNLLALLAIPLAALLFVHERRRRRRFAVRHPAATVVASVTGRAPRWRRVVPPALLALAAALLAVSFARPEATVAVPVERASVMLVTDESGSMAAEDVDPTRLRAAQEAGKSFLERVPGELLVGFVGYSGTVHSTVEPTTEHDQVENAIDALSADGGTATGDALGSALDRLQNRKGDDGTTAPAAVVLLSDGKTTEGSDPVEAAERAAKLGIPVFTVALGTSDGFVTGPSGDPMAVPPDPDTLREIARRSNGEAFQADDGDELDRVYERLGSKIGTKNEQREISAAFAGAGLVLLLGGVGIGLRWRAAFA
jgi:Ca-activated chloride channel family protein